MSTYKSQAETLEMKMSTMSAEQYSAVQCVCDAAAFRADCIQSDVEQAITFDLQPRYASEHLDRAATSLRELRGKMNLLLAIENGTAVWNEKTQEWGLP